MKCFVNVYYKDHYLDIVEVEATNEDDARYKALDAVEDRIHTGDVTIDGPESSEDDDAGQDDQEKSEAHDEHVIGDDL